MRTLKREKYFINALLNVCNDQEVSNSKCCDEHPWFEWSMNITHMKGQFVLSFSLNRGKSRTKRYQQAASLNGASVRLYFPGRFHTVSDNIAYWKGHSGKKALSYKTYFCKINTLALHNNNMVMVLFLKQYICIAEICGVSFRDNCKIYPMVKHSDETFRRFLFICFLI